jgi:Replication protein
MHTSDAVVVPLDVLPQDCEAVLTSLDDSETTRHPLQVQSRAQYALHRRTWERRARVIEALHTSDDFRLSRRAAKLGMCCVSPAIFVQADKLPSCVADRCRDRMCPTCQAFRAGEVRRRLSKCMQSASAVRMITLTMRHDSPRVGACVDSLLGNFRALRKSKAWRKHVKGGAYVVETTRGSDGNRWHVHLHLLVEGSFWSQSEVAAEWSRVVGEKSVVDIRAVVEREKAVAYVTKYVSKGVDEERWSIDAIREYATGMHRRRLMGTFGKWHRCKLDELPDERACIANGAKRVSVAVLWAAIEANAISIERAGPELMKLGRVWRSLVEPFMSSAWEPSNAMSLSELKTLNAFLLEVATFIENAPAPVDVCPNSRMQQFELPWERFRTRHV